MRHYAPALAAAALLAAAGCSKAPEENKAPADTEAPVPAAASESAAAPEPVATASPLATSIPQAIQGRWGMVPLDCTGDPAAAKGLVEIGPKSMKFYESVAKLGAVKSSSADGIDATYAFSGEGQSWTLDVALTVEDGGKTLIRKDTGRDALPGPLKYTRCV